MFKVWQKRLTSDQRLVPRVLFKVLSTSVWTQDEIPGDRFSRENKPFKPSCVPAGRRPSALSELITPPQQTCLRLCGETLFTAPPIINFMTLSLRSVYPKMSQEQSGCSSRRGPSLFVLFGRDVMMSPLWQKTFPHIVIDLKINDFCHGEQRLWGILCSHQTDLFTQTITTRICCEFECNPWNYKVRF